MVAHEIDFSPPRQDRGLFAETTAHPYYDPRPLRQLVEAPVREAPGPGPRVYDPETQTWSLLRREISGAKKPDRPAARGARGDGSGVWWAVMDDRGVVFARIESLRFPLEEKRRICRELGGKSGWCVLRRIVE